MREKARLCQKCKQKVPSKAKFCPFCGIDLSSPVAMDYTQASYAELMVSAKRVEVAILKDEQNIEQLRKQIEDGSLKLNSRKRFTGLGRSEIIETIKQDLLGYKWDQGGLIHPLLGELVRIKEELNRRDRMEDYRQIEQFIRALQGLN